MLSGRKGGIELARNVEVVEFSEDWKVKFLEEAKNLHGLLDGEIIEINHIGSTAISGMSAKPIIDMKYMHFICRLHIKTRD